jgi:RNA polymerase sigma-70 factor (ECF subfamily)
VAFLENSRSIRFREAIRVMAPKSELSDRPLNLDQNETGAGDPTDRVFLAQPFESRMAAAHEGSLSAIGSIFEECRNYLLLIANRQLGQSMQAKIGASDLVQETFLQAQQIFDRFDGGSRQELSVWLAQILEYKLLLARRRLVGTEKRDSSREEPLHPTITDVVRNERLPVSPAPEKAAAHIDEMEQLKLALDRLPTDYQLAIELRSLQQQSFAELGRVLDRSPDAARMTWARAVLRLRKELRRIKG